MIELALEDSLSTDAQSAIEASLRQFNLDHNGEFWAARELPANAPRPLNVVARDALGLVIGGLIAHTQFAWLKIELMAVVEGSRRQGVGRRLLEAAEIEAVRRGCRGAYVDTMDYQAPEFYQRCNYDIAGRLENWDSHGHSKLFLVKRLA